MNLFSWILFGAIMAAFIAAVVHIVGSSRRGQCVGCSGCKKTAHMPACHQGCTKTATCPHCTHK